MRKLVKRSRAEKGQSLIVALLAMTLLLGMVAMSVDTGLVLQDRRHLQNTADAAALAGVAELPWDPASAREIAKQWVLKHGLAESDIAKIEVRTKFVPNDTLFVQLREDFDWIFANALGMTSTTVGAEAAAQVGSLGGNNNIMPWALMQGESSCLDPTGAALFGAACTVKVGPNSSIFPGWYGALDFDGTGGGANEYKDNIIDGTTETRYCIQGDTSPGCTSSVSVIDSLNGNKTGPTDQGIDERLALMGAPCDGNGNSKDDFGEVFAPNTQLKPEYVVTCPQSARLIIIPIVTYNSIPVKIVIIRGWALAYLRDYSCSNGNVTNCQSGQGHWNVNIEIVDAAYSQVGGFMTEYDPLSGITIRRLVD